MCLAEALKLKVHIVSSQQLHRRIQTKAVNSGEKLAPVLLLQQQGVFLLP